MKVIPLAKYKVYIMLFLLFSFSFLINNHNLDFKENNFNINSNGPLTPKGIRLTSVNDSSNSIVISWYTENNASDPKVEYSTDPTLSDSTVIIPTLKYIDGTYNTYIYNANLKNLESNKTYYYKISSDTSNEREILDFTTSPTRNATSLKFLVFGDSRTQREQRSELVNRIVENFDDIDFTIHTGDIVADGRIQDQWNYYFEDVENLTSGILGYYIEGNHEHTDGYMYDNIPLPSNGDNSDYYSFNIGSMNFIGLNSYRNPSIQASWLEAELNKTFNDNYTVWRFVFMHEPIFSSMSTRPDRTDLISYWCPLFEQYDVDMVFAGHNHYYERSYPMNRFKEYDDSFSYNFKNPSYPIYCITGGAGAPLYPRDTNPSYAPFYNSTYHFMLIEINVDDMHEETLLTLETWAMPDDYNNIYLIDNMTILKKGLFINIHSPNENQVFGHNAPNYNITIERQVSKPSWCSINTTWYTIDNGITNHTFTELIGTINQTVWSDQINESIRIIFYANDSLGNIYKNDILVLKDITPPNITILFPEVNDTFGKDPPNFMVIINDPNLDTMWYSLDGGVVNITFTVNGTIDETEWDKFVNATIVLTFFANDTAGNIGFKDIIIEKIISEPIDNVSDDDSYPFLIEFIIYVVLINTIVIISGISLIYIHKKKEKKI